MVTETVQKSVRLSQRAYSYINRYSGWTFTDKLHSCIADSEKLRDEVDRLTFENDQLRLQIQRLKYREG